MKTMKLKNLINLLTLGATVAIAGAGCRHTPTGTTDLGPPMSRTHMVNNPNPEPLPPGQRFPNRNTEPGSSTLIPAGGGELGPDHMGWNAHPDILAAQTIHFDYDKSAVKSSEHSKLDAVVSYLKSHPNDAVRIEGNCDERGTDEYNRSLGERRALAGREYLVGQGIDPTRLDIQTFGKDKPVAFGHDESSWAQNRRDDFVVLTAPGR